MTALNILLVPTLQMPKPDAAVLARIQDAAGPDSTITVAESPGEAYEAIVSADVLLGRIDARDGETPSRAVQSLPAIDAMQRAVACRAEDC